MNFKCTHYKRNSIRLIGQLTCVIPLFAWCHVVGGIEMVVAMSSSAVAEMSEEYFSEEPSSEANKPFGFLCLTGCCLCMVGAHVQGTDDVCTYTLYVNSSFTMSCCECTLHICLRSCDYCG